MGSLFTLVGESAYTPKQVLPHDNTTVNYDQGQNGVASNDQLAGQMAGMIPGVQRQAAPQANQTPMGPTAQTHAATGNASTAPTSNAYLGALNGTNGYLQNQMTGTGPSVAETQLQQGEQNQVANQLAVLGSQRGGSSNALAARGAADQSAASLNALNQNAATARIAEQNNAANTLSSNELNASGQTNAANQFNATQNQNMSLANLGAVNTANAANANAANAQNLQQGSMNQQTDMQNLAAKLSQEGMNNQQIDALLQGQMAANQSNMNYNLGQNNQIIGSQEALNNLQWNQTQAYSNAATGTWNDTMSTAMDMGSLSDVNVKTGVSGGNAMMGSYLDSLEKQGAPNTTPSSGQPLMPAPAAPKSSSAGGGGGMSSMMSMFGGGGSGGGGIMSDEDTKTDISKAGDLLDHLQAYSYHYKQSVEGEQGAPPGEHVGIMAQDLQKSDEGKDLVMKGEDGVLRVPYGSPRMQEVLLAGQAYLNSRMNKIEGKRS